MKAEFHLPLDEVIPSDGVKYLSFKLSVASSMGVCEMLRYDISFMAVKAKGSRSHTQTSFLGSGAFFSGIPKDFVFKFPCKYSAARADS
ncbi:MAG: hypothetical protein WCI18_16625 [Pseudomonadota bacterium]